MIRSFEIAHGSIDREKIKKAPGRDIVEIETSREGIENDIDDFVKYTLDFDVAGNPVGGRSAFSGALQSGSL